MIKRGIQLQVLDVELHPNANWLKETIQSEKTPTIEQNAKAIIFLRHLIYENLKSEYLTVKNPVTLWTNLSDRHVIKSHIRAVNLPEKVEIPIHKAILEELVGYSKPLQKPSRLVNAKDVFLGKRKLIGYAPQVASVLENTPDALLPPKEFQKQAPGAQAEAAAVQGDEDDDDEVPELVPGSHEVQHMLQNIEICSDQENCEARRAPINMTKGFVAKGPMK
ncbi:hypothetical protein AgCh_028268 [Apium graveolens]